MTKDSFCNYCGGPLPDDGYPKTCLNCKSIIWSNPVPVAVCVQPIQDGVRTGLAIARRNIEPKLGTWCMLGGHVDNNAETIEEAAVREFYEESGLALGDNPRITGSHTNGKGHVLVAVEAQPIPLEVWITARLCPENSAFDVLWEHDRELGFVIHQRIAAKWFARRSQLEHRFYS